MAVITKAMLVNLGPVFLKIIKIIPQEKDRLCLQFKNCCDWKTLAAIIYISVTVGSVHPRTIGGRR